ncbi:hypothetical protein [Butyrivibrio sp. INlla14]|uniref:hypothetical protein n=1 Tax=Butyrivibrio sp. INlla14 TaxID=1520808 RepID=UPI000876C27E|nr:hypothetical protein [Butyrivibrio sp. INlla14]SCY18786.1 methyl-accepting chemotaxis protein [Butyrivibrio sp. INlla14]
MVSWYKKLIFAAVAAIVGVATVLTVMGGIKISDTYMKMVQEELAENMTETMSYFKP